VSQKPKAGDYLRRHWKLEQKHQKKPPYTPSYEREGFDESKVIKLKMGEK